MNTTKETIENLKEKEQRMDYYKRVRLAVSYDLIDKQETNESLTKISNTDLLSIRYDGNTYFLYLKENTKEYVYAHKTSTFDEEGNNSIKHTYTLTLATDFVEHYASLEQIDHKVAQEQSNISSNKKPSNNTRIYLITIASIVTIIGVLIGLEIISYSVFEGFLVILTTLFSTAALFGIAEIIKLLSK